MRSTSGVRRQWRLSILPNGTNLKILLRDFEVFARPVFLPDGGVDDALQDVLLRHGRFLGWISHKKITTVIGE
jgi:hypothetical protein